MNTISNPTARGAPGRAALVLTAVTALALGAGAAEPDAPDNKPGDPANGRKVFVKQKCAKCHRIGKEGGLVGPELTKQGEKRPAEWLLGFLKDPRSKLPKTTMEPVKVPEQELQDLVAYLSTLK